VAALQLINYVQRTPFGGQTWEAVRLHLMADRPYWLHPFAKKYKIYKPVGKSVNNKML
jgi:hypothetical protein